MTDTGLNDIPTFLDVVETGSFTAAAARHRVTRSAIAKSIARTEARLGIRLFHRTTRQQTLTDEGSRYYEHCRRWLAELRDMETALRDERQGAEGRVKISAPVLFGRHCVAPVMRELLRTHPRLDVAISFSDRVVDIADEGFDLAIRIGELPDSSSLIARPIGRQRMGIYASPVYLAAHGRPTTIEEIQAHTGILYGTASDHSRWRVLDHDGQQREIRMQGRQCHDDLQVIADAAIEGDGLAWLPCWLGNPYVKTGQLDSVMDYNRVLSFDIHVIWPRSAYLPYRTRLTIEALLERIPQRMG
ncbi:LysR family transcriptional regulator [Parathalassolituus penaei]|uniref:LysR family transcriptional regulator n=1 Tax=Parathalassolituus penaei TaxID=2997323 RepID=A0A9X3ITV0_9GAMM|nr:LysR family transcriptional regulator [Parathalassolituus penaei]MCY0967266.1 LysR family transcriptional regulator [Parathalassolituus penaei]